MTLQPYDAKRQPTRRARHPADIKLSEALIGHQLLKAGIHVEHSRTGPDFVFSYDNHRIWLEVICPEPKGLPDEWTRSVPGSGALHLPHEFILLRWTAALKEKAEKLWERMAGAAISMPELLLLLMCM